MSQNETRCRRCLRLNRGDPWYCPQCGKETTLTPHDGGTYGDSVAPLDALADAVSAVGEQ